MPAALSVTLDLLPEIAHQMSLVPLCALALIRVTGTTRGPAWWWIAAGYAVSWAPDYAVHLGVRAEVASNLYPITQAGIIAAVIGPRGVAAGFILLMGCAAWVMIAWRGPDERDVLLSTIAFFGVAALAWHSCAGLLRAALIVMFGVGQLLWLGYLLWPFVAGGYGTWGAYQLARAAGIALFCIAAVRR